MNINDVVQFTENHKWCGCFGYISEIKHYEDDTRYMIGVPVPQGGTAYIFSMGSENDFEYIGPAVIIASDSEDEEE